MSLTNALRRAHWVRLIVRLALVAVTLSAVTAAAGEVGAAATPRVPHHGGSAHASSHIVGWPTTRDLAANPHVTIGNTACGNLTVSPSTAVTGGEGLQMGLTWTANTSTPGCAMLSNSCPTFAGDCSAGYWLVGLFCSTLAATNLATGQSDCDLNNIVVFTDDSSGPDNSGSSGTSYNTCTTVNTLGSIFGGLPGTLNCITDGGTRNGWTDNWPRGATSGSASGVFEQTGSGTPFNPSAAGVDCPPSAANIAAGAIPNTCAFVVMPVSFQYFCVFDACVPNVSDANDGISENTSDYLATLFQYPYAPTFTSTGSATVQAGSYLDAQISTSGSPTPTVTASGTLPPGVSFTQGTGGTAVLSGTPSLTSAGTYLITLTAGNGVGPNAVQEFSLTVTPPPPTISGISPGSGPAAGGTTVTITGSNFTGVSAVAFGPTAASRYTVISPSVITAVSPAGAGPVSIGVTTPSGTGSSAGQFTYIPAPTISGFSPASGPAAGGTTVTITGTNLTGASSVTFGTAAATHVTVVSPTIVTALSPPGTGSVAVGITTPGGTAKAASQFTFVPAPTISSNGLSPAVGPQSGGTPVTITGTNLAGTSGVTFGGAAATDVIVISPTEVTALSPAGTGAVTVRLTTPGGTAMSPAPFTYYPSPSGLAISPFDGSSGGGATVTITGTNLSGAEAVEFGSSPATGVTVVSPSEITAVSPAGSGSVAVSVSTPGGTAVATPQFTYVPGPSVSGVAPPDGPESGGTAVTITGTGLSGATAVSFGSSPAAFSNVTAGSLTAYAPPGTGTVPVVVTTPGGTATSPTQFTYAAPVSVSGISPASGPTAGGTVVTLTGTGLLGTEWVTFGSQAGTAISNLSDTSLTVTAPPGIGTVDVTVGAPGGVGASPTQFSYVAPPAPASISPATGPSAGGTTVTITGSGLSGTTAVDFGSNSAPFGFVTDDSITATAPPGSGTVDVSVTTAGGSATSLVQFTYFSPPQITSVSPADGPQSGRSVVTITGSGLGGATGVEFGGVPGELLGAGPSSVTAMTPAGTGTVDVAVLTPLGTALSPEQFDYLPLPVVSSISPASGPLAGGITVTVTGSGLSGATGVHFGRATARFADVSDTSVTVVEPPGSGVVDVSVTTPGGSSAPGKHDRFTYARPPTISALSPTSGAPAGGSVVEVVGTNLCDPVAVRFGANPGSKISVNAACTILAVTTPAWTGRSPTVPHPVPVVVETPSGSAPAPVEFTYVIPGYWMVAADGRVFGFGGATYYGSMGGHHLNKPIVAMADTPNRGGYWLFASDGGVFAFGDAKFYGSVPLALGPGRSLNAPIVAVESTPDGRGYRMFAADGGVFDFGDAKYVGSLPGQHVHPNKPIVAATSNPVGQGYWLVGADGGIYTFPDAVYKGSLGGEHLTTSITWMANTVTGGGYWIFGANGEVWALGDARPLGGEPSLSAPVVAGVATTTDGGYWLIGMDGGAYRYGDAPALGSLPAMHITVDDIVGGVGF